MAPQRSRRSVVGMSSQLQEGLQLGIDEIQVVLNKVTRRVISSPLREGRLDDLTTPGLDGGRDFTQDEADSEEVGVEKLSIRLFGAC